MQPRRSTAPREERRGAVRRPRPSCASRRRGSALLVVLVVVTLLTLAAYSFTDLMVSESRASRQFARDSQARALADSAVDYVAAWLGNPELEPGVAPNYYHNAALFAGVSLVASEALEGEGWFSVVAPAEADPASRTIRYGLMNESARLNLNALVNYDLDEATQRAFLMPLPGMTEALADAILDWIDSDDAPREFGAESDTYQTLTPPYFANDAPLDSIDDLLLVVGVTPDLLYGEDANRNGLLDPNENDGALTLPYDDEDGFLRLGWAAYLTTSSRESNLRADGSTKINVNQSILTDLYDQIEEEYGEDMARFITAYRLFGGANVEPLDDTGVSSTNTTGNTQTDTALQNLARSVANSLTGNAQGSATRGGLDCTAGAVTDIASLFELLGAEVDAEVDGQPQTLVSPFSADQESLTLLFENFTTNAATSIDGRININEAREEVLLGLPYMPAELPASIVASRPLNADGTPVDDVIARRNTTGWLLLEGLADLTTMRRLDRYITVSGQVYRMQAVGRFTGRGPTARVEAVIDASETPPRIVFRRDLGNLGPGYRPEQLRPVASP